MLRFGRIENFYKRDVALLQLILPVPTFVESIPLCTEKLPYTLSRHLLGMCGVGSMSKRKPVIPDILQEAVFFESMYVSDSSPYSFLWCPDDLVCVDALTKG